MKHQFGNVFHAGIDFRTDPLIIPTNGYLNVAGNLVMGRGVAAEVRKRYPDVPRLAGREIRRLGLQSEEDGIWLYPLLTIKSEKTKHNFVLFQVKHHFQSDADIDLILSGIYQLRLISEIGLKYNYSVDFHLPLPGTGNGRLSRDLVLPICDKYLPDSVTVWELPVED